MNFYQATVERPYKGFEPSRELVEEIKSAFIDQALAENPNGTSGDIEVIKTALVTGQTFSMTLKIGLVSHESVASRQGETDASGDQPVEESTGNRRESKGRSGSRSRSS